MRKMILCMPLCIACVLMAPQVSFSLDGTGYKDIGEAGQILYIGGVLDGWHHIYELSKFRFKQEGLAPAPVEKVVVHIENCIDDRHMQFEQIKAIIDKYRDDHPNQWHYRMSWMVLKSLQDACNE